MKKLILIGFMGAGKTTIGQLLAAQLGVPALEMDQMILEASGYPSIPKLFDDKGEAYFRALETMVARELASLREGVISTGGGIILHPENLAYLRRNGGVVVLLRVSFETAQARLQGDDTRPLFVDLEEALARFVRRVPLYEAAADLIVDVDVMEPEAIAAKIVARLGRTTSAIDGKTKLCVIVGDPVEHSLSPKMHNAAYAATGLEGSLVYVAARVRRGALPGAVAGMRSMGLRGLTCTLPHKTDILPLLDEIDEVAQAIGAVNTVVQEDEKLIGYNTDWLGIVRPLERRRSLRNVAVGVLGAGGTARAAIVGLQRAGVGHIYVFNRTLARAQAVAEELGCEAHPLDAIALLLPGCDVIVQTTSVGMAPQVEQTLVPLGCLRAGQIVLDAIYSPFETQLLRDAKTVGATIIRGAEMFLEQGVAQFELYAQTDAPYEVMKRVVCESFGVEEL